MSAQTLLLDSELPPNVKFSQTENMILVALEKHFGRNKLEANLQLLVNTHTNNTATVIYTGLHDLLVTVRYNS